MIDNYLLEELVTFSKYGTLAATAEQLLVTQPTVTRGMQKLEEELGVKIFDRQPNHISLTKTGELAAEEAQKVIDQNNTFIETVQKYEDSHKVIRLGTVAPGPVILLRSMPDKLASNLKIDDQLLSDTSLVGKLEKNDYSLIISDQEIMTDEIESRFIGTESLSVNLDKFTYLANKTSVSFKELAGISFIVINDIGIWKDVIKDNIPDAKFLYQEQTDAFTEITKYSNFPYFSTNISHFDHHHSPDDDRVHVPISDESSNIDFYASYLKSQKRNVNPPIKLLIDSWN